MPRKASGTPRTKKNEDFILENPKAKNPFDLNTILHMREELKCKNKTQKELITLINEKELIIAAGPAGVGKSYVTIARALELLKNNKNTFSKIIISTPAVEAEEKLGFLPGDAREKLEPYVASSLDIFDKLIGKTNRMKLEELGFLEIQALAYIRGKSIDNTILIMEEAQNMSPNQMKTLLTRIGENSKFIISGDLDQSDRYRNITQSGLYDALKRHRNVSEIGFIEFSNDEIVRNPVISKILVNYKREEYTKPTSTTNPLTETMSSNKPNKSLIERFFNLFR